MGKDVSPLHQLYRFSTKAANPFPVQFAALQFWYW